MLTLLLLSLPLTLMLLAVRSSSAAAPSPTQVYAHRQQLTGDNSDNVWLFWNYTANDILFELHVRTTGWASFGLSPTGGMANSDIMVVWLSYSNNNNNNSSSSSNSNSSGSALGVAPRFHFSDRHIDDRGKVSVDLVQNWFPLRVTASDGYLVCQFTRHLRLCDASGQDRDIDHSNSQSVWLIYAWSDQFKNDDITYHGSGRRGAKAVVLVNATTTSSGGTAATQQAVEARSRLAAASDDMLVSQAVAVLTRVENNATFYFPTITENGTNESSIQVLTNNSFSSISSSSSSSSRETPIGLQMTGCLTSQEPNVYLAEAAAAMASTTTTAMTPEMLVQTTKSSEEVSAASPEANTVATAAAAAAVTEPIANGSAASPLQMLSQLTLLQLWLGTVAGKLLLVDF